MRKDQGMAKPQNLVGYIRVSTSEQATSGLGLDAQRTSIESAVKAQGWTLSEIVVDGGETGANLDRPGLTRALEMVAAGEVDGMVAAKLDRISRSVVDFSTLLAWFVDARASLVVLDPAMDTSTPSGRLVANVFASVAEWEREIIAARTQESLVSRRASGRPISRPAVVDRGELAERIQSMRTGGATMQAIADALNAEGMPTLRGGTEWRPSAVQSAIGYQRPRKAHRPANLPTIDRRRRKAPVTP